MSQKNNSKIAIITSNYHKEICDSLLSACTVTLKENGVSEKNLKSVRVPGALEIIAVAKKLAKQKKYDAIIVFGVVLKGDTYHFEQVADECARGVMRVSYDYDIPVIFQVLSVYKLKDAEVRAEGKNNRGIEAAETALEIIKTLKSI